MKRKAQYNSKLDFLKKIKATVSILKVAYLEPFFWQDQLGCDHSYIIW